MSSADSKGSRAKRKRINVSLTEKGLQILDEERRLMGLSRSAFVEVVVRFWVRDQTALAHSIENLLADCEDGRPMRGEVGKVKK